MTADIIMMNDNGGNEIRSEANGGGGVGASNKNKLPSLSIKKPSLKNVSYFSLLTCLASLILAFLFKDYLINLLIYLEDKSKTNALEFHIILLLMFVLVSLPILWGYMVCVLICAYVYSIFYGFLLVVTYSTIGMSVSFVVCRYMLYDCARLRVQSYAYLRALSTVIESKEKGVQVVFLSRLMPIPFGLANTLFSVTDIQFRKYMLASVIGLTPSQFILCYMGSTLKSMTDVLVNRSTARTAYLVFVAQLIIAVLVMYYILRAARNELNKHLGENSISNKIINHDASLLKMFANNKSTSSSCPYCNRSSPNVDCEHCQLLLSVDVQS